MYCPRVVSATRLRHTRYVDRAKQAVPEVLPDTPYYSWEEKPHADMAVSSVAVVIRRLDRRKPFGFHCPYEMQDIYYTYWIYTSSPYDHGVLNSDYRTFDELGIARDRMIRELEEYVSPR